MEKIETYKIAAILTCYNRREKTLSCLDSLSNISLPKGYDLDIFLVDDGSTDGTGEAVREQYSSVNVIQGDGNLFWSKGMNVAWKTARNTFDYDFYLWLNDDVVLFDKLIETLLRDYLKLANKNSIIVGPCMSSKGSITYSGYTNLFKKVKIIPNGVTQECNHFNGNIVFIPKTVFNEVGFIDPVFHHSQGDFDYGLRAKKLGISSFVSSEYLGICEANSELPIWCNPKYPITKRLKLFNTPLGGRPKLTYIFQRRHMGFVYALFHYFTIHIRVIFPQLWRQV